MQMMVNFSIMGKISNKMLAPKKNYKSFFNYSVHMFDLEKI